MQVPTINDGRHTKQEHRPKIKDTRSKAQDFRPFFPWTDRHTKDHRHKRSKTHKRSQTHKKYSSELENKNKNKHAVRKANQILLVDDVTKTLCRGWVGGVDKKRMQERKAGRKGRTVRVIDMTDDDTFEEGLWALEIMLVEARR
jgi:hypothetical protein